MLGGGSKYEHLVINCCMQGWKVTCMPIEVGCRGFVGQFLHRALGVMGITGGVRSRNIKNITEAAEKASRCSKEKVHGDKQMPPEHKAQSDQPWLGRLVRGEDPKNITDDVFRSIRTSDILW